MSKSGEFYDMDETEGWSQGELWVFGIYGKTEMRKFP